MRNLLIATAIAATALSGAAVAGEKAAADGEAKLATLLSGMRKGEAVGCMATPAMASVVEGTAIVFRRGNTLYVNRPRSGQDRLFDRASVARKAYSGQLCEGQALEMADGISGLPKGHVVLGDFVPYRLERTSAR